MLFLPRRHAPALLPEDAVQVSSIRISLCAAGLREWPAHESRSRIRAARYQCIRWQSLFRYLRGVRKSDGGRHFDSRHSMGSRKLICSDRSAPDDLVPEYVVLARRNAAAPALASA